MEEGFIDTTEVVAVPVVIYTKLQGGYTTFVVPEVGAWTWEYHGVFASGHWEGDEPGVERDVLIPYSELALMEYDFDALMYASVDSFIEGATSEDSD